MQLCSYTVNYLFHPMQYIVNSWHVENKHMPIDCYAYSTLMTYFFNVYLLQIRTLLNSFNTWECVLLNTYHISNLLQSQCIQ